MRECARQLISCGSNTFAARSSQPTRRCCLPVPGRSTAGTCSLAFQLTDEFIAAGSQAGNDSVDILDGEWNFVSSSRPLPSGVCIIAMSARTPSSRATRSTQRPSTVLAPCNTSPGSTKNSVAAARSSTTTPNVFHPLDSHVLDGEEQIRAAAAAIRSPIVIPRCNRSR
jgi:hypothetical protein